MLENQSGEKILAERSDGAAEIFKLFGEWKSRKELSCRQLHLIALIKTV